MNRHLFRGSKANRDRRDLSFARSVIAEAERRRQTSQDKGGEPCSQAGESPATSSDTWPDERPIGECEHCGAAFYDEGEKQYHAIAECVGGMERFRL